MTTQTAAPIETTVQEGVATIWLNRPDRLNALSIPLINAACERLAAWELDTSVRCVVIRGRGRSFCAGDDLKGMDTENTGRDTMEYTLRRESGFERLAKAVYHLRKPVIAALHGHVYGAGLMVALCCDMRIATEDALLAAPFAKIGITGATTIVSRYTGIGKATEMLFTGDPVTGRDAVLHGLVNYAVPSDQFDAEVDRWASKLAAGPTRVLGAAKYALHKGLYQDLDTAFALNSYAMLLAQQTQDREEGLAAFREKRAPVFKGI